MIDIIQQADLEHTSLMVKSFPWVHIFFKSFFKRKKNKKSLCVRWREVIVRVYVNVLARCTDGCFASCGGKKIPK